MIIVAVIFDLLGLLLNLLHLIPVVGNVVAFVSVSVLSIVAWMTLYIWFKTKGVSFNTSRRMLSLGGGFLVELIPILNALPAWTLSTILVIASTRIPKALGGTGTGSNTAQNESGQSGDNTTDM